MRPLGLAEVPEVWIRKPGSLASMGSGGQSALAVAMRSAYQRSRPGTMGTSPPMRWTTTTCSMAAMPSMAVSRVSFRMTRLPRRTLASAATTTLGWASSRRSRTAWAENPAKITA